MNEYVLSACIGVFGTSNPIESVLNLLNRYGYRGIELLGEPGKYDILSLKKLLRQRSLKVTALTACSRLKTGRDLAAKNKLVRQKTIDHYKNCLEVACELSVPLIGVTLTAVGRHDIEDDYNSEYSRALESVYELSVCAKKMNKTIIIETLNRYASFMMNTLDECNMFIVSNHLENVGICADLFHMNIEEKDIAQSIKESNRNLKNIHVSDSNRLGIGYGHMDFHEILKTLTQMRYSGPLTLETWAKSKNPFSNKGSAFEEISGYIADFSEFCSNFNDKTL